MSGPVRGDRKAWKNQETAAVYQRLAASDTDLSTAGNIAVLAFDGTHRQAEVFEKLLVYVDQLLNAEAHDAYSELAAKLLTYSLGRVDWEALTRRLYDEWKPAQT